ncbi:hypothetical protein DFH27DRAFT_526895 [Peziza echinospora]|nr:hypothetical protein DFH27DRAFT_526895 [Peziza echinospora]
MVPRLLGLHRLPPLPRSGQLIRIRYASGGSGGGGGGGGGPRRINHVAVPGTEEGPQSPPVLPHGTSKVSLYYVLAVEDNIIRHNKLRQEFQLREQKRKGAKVDSMAREVDTRKRIGIGYGIGIGGARVRLSYNPEGYFGDKYLEELRNRQNELFDAYLVAHSRRATLLSQAPLYQTSVKRISRATTIDSENPSLYSRSLKNAKIPPPQDENFNQRSNTTSSSTINLTETVLTPRITHQATKERPPPPTAFPHSVNLPIPPEGDDEIPMKIPRSWNLPLLSSPTPLHSTALPFIVHIPIPISKTPDIAGPYIPRIPMLSPTSSTSTLGDAAAAAVEQQKPIRFSHLVELPVLEDVTRKTSSSSLRMPIVWSPSGYLREGADSSVSVKEQELPRAVTHLVYLPDLQSDSEQSYVRIPLIPSAVAASVPVTLVPTTATTKTPKAGDGSQIIQSNISPNPSATDHDTSLASSIPPPKNTHIFTPRLSPTKSSPSSSSSSSPSTPPPPPPLIEAEPTTPPLQVLQPTEIISPPPQSQPLKPKHPVSPPPVLDLTIWEQSRIYHVHRDTPQLPTHLRRKYYHELNEGLYTPQSQSNSVLCSEDNDNTNTKPQQLKQLFRPFEIYYQASVRKHLDLGCMWGLVESSYNNEVEVKVAEEEEEAAKVLRIEVLDPLMSLLREDVLRIQVARGGGPSLMVKPKTQMEQLQEKIALVREKINTQKRNQFWWKRLHDPGVVAQGIPTALSETEKYRQHYLKKAAARKEKEKEREREKR